MKHRRRWGSLRSVGAMATAGCFAAGAMAQPEGIRLPRHQGAHEVILEDQKDDRPIEFENAAAAKAALNEIITHLGSGDFQARRAAAEKLGKISQFTLEMLEDALQRKDLTLEARSRLLGAARKRFFETPRAALGFQFGGTLRDRIVIGRLIDGFPAKMVLEEGDMIMSADGYRLEGPVARAVLPAVIVSHDPGETIKLVVRRGAQKLTLDVPLGEFARLEQGAWMGPERLAPAWRIRAARLGGGPEPIRVELDRDAWVSAGAQKAVKQERGQMEPIAVDGGGMPRLMRGQDAQMLAMNELPMLMQRGGVVVINGRPQARAVGAAALLDIDVQEAPVPIEEELNQLARDRATFERRVVETEEALAKATDDESRMRLQDGLSELRKMVGLIGKQSEALRAEAAEQRIEGEAKRSSSVDAMDARQ
ncbi:MAG: hypothetical protein K2W85_06670 [Phycisphaerales bacterium]|nr:hypothetical protein [Phycisphaerales bacterium]